MDKILKRDSLGGGDIKLLFVIGLYLGLGTGLFNLILSCLTGLVFVFILKRDRIPFGPAISLATAFSLLYGSQLVNMYLRIVGL
jgi:leader peptidase (prepilin peptidase)/N-methyltransferase